MSKATAPIYQIKIMLKDSRPPIWRRLLISSETTLPKLHMIIQEAMGWYDSHLHAFAIHGEHYSAPSPYDPGHLAELGMKSTHRVKLNSVIQAEGEKFQYEYDFGDGWQHEILIEKILPADPKQKLPVCLTGKRACPPEDIGGVWGYEGFLEAINDPGHPEHENYLEWIGGPFNPDAFDLAAVNDRLKRLR
jgi:hypothetical protein